MKLKAFHKFSYGLYIIASEFEGKKAGYIANTTFQVTAEPPQLAISCHKNNQTTEVILSSGNFSVSVLKKEVNMKIIGDFGFSTSAEIDKFGGINYIKGPSGAPIVMDSSVAWFDCKVMNSVDLGTHYLIIGEVLDADEITDEDPLTYQHYREKYRMYSPKNSPTYIEKSRLNDEFPSVSEQLAEPEHEHVFDGESYVCVICGFTYNPEDGDPSMGIPPGTRFEDLPEDYKCPICNAGKEYFKKV